MKIFGFPIVIDPTLPPNTFRVVPPARMGRPPLSDKPAVKFTLKMTPEQRAKLDRLGGAEWIRTKIDKAKEPGNG